MKKIVLSILTLTYLMVASGFAMEIHYCMGKRSGVDLYGSASEKCGMCGMKEKKTGCCHDEHKFYKLTDSHKNVTNNISFETGEVALAIPVPVFDWSFSIDNTIISNRNFSPPPDTGPSACILNCVFRL